MDGAVRYSRRGARAADLALFFARRSFYGMRITSVGGGAAAKPADAKPAERVGGLGGSTRSRLDQARSTRSPIIDRRHLRSHPQVRAGHPSSKSRARARARTRTARPRAFKAVVCQRVITAHGVPGHRAPDGQTWPFTAIRWAGIAGLALSSDSTTSSTRCRGSTPTTAGSWRTYWPAGAGIVCLVGSLIAKSSTTCSAQDRARCGRPLADRHQHDA